MAAGEGSGGSAAEIHRRVQEYWDRTGVLERALAGPAQGPIFRFTEGPMTANGLPHMGHVAQRTLKDVELRYRRMRGARVVSSMAGWDCHGLPVELQVERELGLKSKREIEAYGVEKFCDACRNITLSTAAVIEEMSRRLGYWLDYRHAYFTMDPKYIQSVWWSLKTLFDRGLLEKGHYVLPYCPRCETPLSSHEVAQGYHETTDPSVTVRFPLLGPATPRRDLLVWTTTPWTLPANLLVAARADLMYAVVRAPDGTEVVLAEGALPRYFPPDTPVVDRIPGSQFAGREYRPPFGCVPPGPGRFRVVLDESVEAKEGTGFVHTAPSFGPEDYRIGAREGVGTFDPLDSRGRFTEAVPLVQGKAFKVADPILVRDLADRGVLFREESLKHTYPFCWRCDSALLYRAIDSWFVRTSRFTDRLVRHNATVIWIPAYLRDGRFGNFLTEAKDWALSRNRYWGTPLPVWSCAAGHFTCVGSFSELAERVGAPLPDNFDPHRIGVDALAVRCGTCGEPSRREPYTIDAWYDSGSAPFAQYHYPFEPGPFVPDAPLDFICEGLDQTRGWFYVLLVVATAMFDRPGYRTCLSHGIVLDEEGRKMSKSKGNAADPMVLLDRFGGDAVRWAFLTSDYTESMRIGEVTVRRTGGRLVSTLANIVAFYRENARADGLAPVVDRPEPTSALDRWILSRLEGTRDVAHRALEASDPRPAAQAVDTLVDDLSTWYLRRSRPRFWADRTDPDRLQAHATLSYVLAGLARLLAPLAPFTAEWVHQEVAGAGFAEGSRSVHLTHWPGPLAARAPELEAGMAELRTLVEGGRELRQRAQVRSRIPLAEVVLFGNPSPGIAALGADSDALLEGELNVRAVRWVPASEAPTFPESDWVVRVDRDVPVLALPRSPTTELAAEGIVREVLRRLQQTRKELGLRYTEEVEVTIATEGDAFRALSEHRESIRRELLANPLTLLDGKLPDDPAVRRWTVDDLTFAATIAPTRR